jgi:hypothetical protein
MTTQTMNQLLEITKQLQELIAITKAKQENYLAECDIVDGYVMSLDGQITGYKTAINLIKINFMKGN